MNIAETQTILCGEPTLNEVASRRLMSKAMNKERTGKARTLAERVKSQREKQGWSQKELADRVRSTDDQIAQIESGKTKRPRNLDKIAKAFGVSEVWLAYGHEQGDTPAALDDMMLEAALEAVDSYIDAHKLDVPRAAKARLVAALYRLISVNRQTDRATISEMACVVCRMHMTG